MRLRDLGITPGRLPTGTLNMITDVTGVRVGHVTLISGEGRLQEGYGPIRTGVTAVLPHGGNTFREKVAAGVCSINGFGKATGFEQIRERGTIETPILMTNTLNVGRVSDALVGYMLRENPDIALTTGTVNPVVGECNDGFLNDIRGRHVHEAHVWEAIDSAAGGIVAEGNVGAGTGTACFQFKGGIGTASRVVLDGRFTVGALVQSNYGERVEMMIYGVPLGQHLRDEYLPQPGAGSIIMVIATDAPLDGRQLSRLAMRAAFALGRTGTVSHDGSGDFAIAFSTANPSAHYPTDPVEMAERFNESGRAINALFLAVVEAVEEAIWNSVIAAETMTGRDGNTLYALPHDILLEWFDYYRRKTP
jgi:D-aminopeptidase